MVGCAGARSHEDPLDDAPEGRFAAAVVAPIAGAVFVVGMLPAFGESYGYFVDELYYLACAKRPAAGYVDHPPLAPLVLRLVTAVLGESLLAVRLLPAASGALVVVLTGWIAHRLGGSRTRKAKNEAE